MTYEYFWCTKWLIEGARSLDEMAEGLENAAKLLREMEVTGRVTLGDEVDGGMVALLTEDPAIADKFGFVASEWDEEEDVGEDDEDSIS